ncbi:MAG: DNA polymerase I [Acidimicrobiia bacterium]|nr:MAG: DNA polymerase I [Acidimicrobiia bacterium]
MTKLALLDGHSLAYRAFYALPPDLATPSGQITNAVFGFTSMLIKLLDEERPDAMAVAWDRKEPTFRTERYPEYKATRTSAPEIFRSQIPLISDVLEAMEIPQIGVAGFEADDIIATLAKQGRHLGYDVVVVTGDRDAFQLSADDLTILYTRRGITDTVHATPAWIEKRYGIPPERYVEYAALRGDASDNLPGVPGVGEKTAAKLIVRYDSLEALYDDLEAQTPKLAENLSAARDQVFLNRELMTMIEDVPTGDVDPNSLIIRPFDRDTVRALFDELAFTTLWRRLEELGGVEQADRELLDVEVITATTDERASTAAASEPAAIEAVWRNDDLVGVVCSGAPAIFVPLERAAALFGASGEHLSVAGHDLKPLVRALLEAEIEPPRIAFDTMIAAYVINPAQRAPSLEDLARRELGVDVGEVGREDGAGTQPSFSFEEHLLDLDMSARRAVAVERLVEPLSVQLAARGGLDLFNEIEIPLIAILADMEHTGIGLDQDFLDDYGSDLSRRIEDLQASICQHAGRPFNINSTQQLRSVLFDELGLPVVKKTPKGVPSTDASVLEKLADHHEIVAELLTFRELDKLRSTYVESLLKLVDADGRIRGRFNQTGAATGRLSMERPNLQNIPVRSEEGRAIRRAFVAAQGSSFLVADYSQIELRILAHMSGDPGMIDAFEHDIDVHAATAARVNGVGLDDVTDAMRRTSKMINFGLLYGMEAYGLAQRLDISRDEAQGHIDVYFEQFPEVRAYMSGIVEEARHTGYTTTILGRRRYLPELNSENSRDRQMGERMALNAPIQGSAADIIKKAMIELERELRSSASHAQMLLQIHDELVLEVPDEELETVTDLTLGTMQDVATLRVPLKVSHSVGRTLADAAH